MEYKLYVKFPCGYELDFTMRNQPLWEAGFGKVDFDDKKLPLCPLHGKNCPKKKGGKSK